MPLARRRFGQHFLERSWADKLIQAIAPSAEQTFLEVGPGRGALTLPLADRARHVLAVEIDRDLATGLRAIAPANLTVIDADFLDLTADQLRDALRTGVGLEPASLRVVGNLPYNVASPILFKLVALHAAGMPLADASVMLQREVADRLTAAPGTKEYGVLTVLIGQSAAVRRLMALPPGAFRPAPQVHSAVVRLEFHAPEPAARDARLFTVMVQSIFTRRRKTLANALKAFPPSATLAPAAALAAADLDGRRRPETLSIPEMVRLADAFASNRPGAEPATP
ncbi:MAG: 16S rRNA (adenine(1518)-N(6)/adenine(1519)-N(6))-dimethyltransferase RsmA [Acidobacteriota bacterium]